MENLRDKEGKFSRRKRLANGESISCRCLFYITIDTHVNSDWAKTTECVKNRRYVFNEPLNSDIFNSKNLISFWLSTPKLRF